MRYLAFYKPYAVLSQFSDACGRSTLKDYLPIPGIYPAGRLDYRSEGLLILSDDGEFIHRLTHPRHALTKTYLAQVEGVVTPEAIRLLNQTILLPGLQTRLAQARLIPTPDLPPHPSPSDRLVRGPTTWLEIVLSEGKKHQVRRMTAAVGFPTLRLVRIAIGPIRLGSLQPGQWRPLTRSELRAVERLLHPGRLRGDRPPDGSIPLG